MKKCFKCKRVKSIGLFYIHKRMKDGHLNKCISCSKKDVEERYYNPIHREKIKIYERNRFKDPERKKSLRMYQLERRRKNPGKYRASYTLTNAIRDGRLIRKPCCICGEKKSEAHHKDYRKPLKVVWLCFRHHREAHNQLID